MSAQHYVILAKYTNAIDLSRTIDLVTIKKLQLRR